MLFALAAALPALLWDAPPDTAAALRDAGVASVKVPAERLEAWKLAGIAVEQADLRDIVKLLAPAVQYRQNVASATNAPWINSNGWRILRNPGGRFLYETQGARSALAAAEAFCFGASAIVHPDSAGLKPFAEMLQFLRGLDQADGRPVSDIAFFDDGSGTSGEVMNMMVRDNLLFAILPERARVTERDFKLAVHLGTKDFPAEDAKNPSMMAHEIRAKITDDRRSLRIYGSQVVVGRLTALRDGVRVHLLNYAGPERRVDGVRVRVLGIYPHRRVAVAGSTQVELLDAATDAEATEFTLPELGTYAVIDLTR